jgi:hypothetical protein
MDKEDFDLFVKKQIYENLTKIDIDINHLRKEQ